MWNSSKCFLRKRKFKSSVQTESSSRGLKPLLFEVFAKNNKIEIRPESLLNLINVSSYRSCREQLDNILQDKSFAHITNKYEESQTKVQDKHLGRASQFWISFMDNTKLVILLTHSIKTNNMKLFHKCNGEMVALFFAFIGQNYWRWVLLSFFEIPLDNVKMPKQHSSRKTIDRNYDINTRVICLSFFFLGTSLGFRCTWWI